MLWLLACGPVETAIDAPNLALWGHLALGSSVLMFLQAPVTAYFLRGGNAPLVRSKAVLVPAALGVLGGLLLWWTVSSGGPGVPDEMMGNRLALLALLLIGVTVFSLGAGILHTLAEAPSHQQRAERKHGTSSLPEEQRA